jgi:hypothetical protein
VERTFAWLGQSRRLANDYERLPETAVAMIYWAMSRIMLRRPVSAVSSNVLRRAYEGNFEAFCKTDSKAVINEVGPPLRCLLLSTAREAPEHPTRQRQITREGAGVHYRCTTQ